MNIKNKLAEWKAANLIDDATVTRVLDYEKQRTRPTALLSVAALGAGTVALGIVSVVAANWEGIPYSAKLVADLLLLSALAGGVLWAEMRAHPVLREVLILIYYGGGLASIALLGQIYQTGAPTWMALCLWTGMTGPLLLLARSRWLAWFWTLGLLTTYSVSSAAGVEELHDSYLEGNVVMVLLLLAPLSLVSASKLSWLRSHRPAFSETFKYAGWALLCWGLVWAPIVFYDDIRSEAHALVDTLINGVFLGGFVALLPKWLDASKRATFATQVTLLIGWFVFALGTSFPREDWQLVGALGQLLMLALLSWVVALRHWTRAFNLLTAALAVRVLVVYFEVFGSLLDTGMGLISGGLLTLLLAWLWKRKSPGIAQQLAEELQPRKEDPIGH